MMPTWRLAANRLGDIGGGFVVAEGGKVLPNWHCRSPA